MSVTKFQPSPNHALQRTGAAVTPAASCLRLSPATQRSRQPRPSAELGVVRRRWPLSTMKRNLDTVRKLLEIFEEAPAGEPIMTFAGEFDNTGIEIIAHIELLIDAGLLEGEAHPDPRIEGGGYFVVTKITWSGHDFINASRSDDIWNATKRRIGQVGGWTFGLVLEVLKDEAKRRIGLVIEP